VIFKGCANKYLMQKIKCFASKFLFWVFGLEKRYWIGKDFLERLNLGLKLFG